MMLMITTPYFALFTIAVFAFLIPLLCGRIGVPAVVGELICGIIVGRSVLGLFTGEEEGIAFLASFGFIFLMFLVGLQIDFSQVEVHGAKLFILGTLLYLLTLGISIFLVYNLISPTAEMEMFYLALVFSTSAVGVIVPTIGEQGLLRSELGQTIIISAFIADFATVALITVHTLHLEKGLTWEMFLIPLVFVLFFVFYYVGKLVIWHYPERLSKWFKSDQPSEIGVRASFALLLVFVVLAEVVGVGAILGAFLAGVILAILFRGGTVLEQKLYGIGYGFLVPIFFITVGMKFELDAVIGGGIYLIPLLLLIAFLVKIVPSMLLLTRHSFKDRFSAGILLSSRLSLIIAVAAVGIELELITVTMGSAILLLAIITSISCPTIFRRLHPKRRRERGP